MRDPRGSAGDGKFRGTELWSAQLAGKMRGWGPVIPGGVVLCGVPRVWGGGMQFGDEGAHVSHDQGELTLGERGVGDMMYDGGRLQCTASLEAQLH